MKRIALFMTLLPLLTIAQTPTYKTSSYLLEGNKAPNINYIGEAWLYPLLQVDGEVDYNITKATFPGKLHTRLAQTRLGPSAHHRGGQSLLPRTRERTRDPIQRRCHQMQQRHRTLAQLDQRKQRHLSGHLRRSAAHYLDRKTVAGILRQRSEEAG